MHRAAAKLLLLITATIVGSLSPVTHALQRPHKPAAGNVTASCRPHERDALLAFKRGITKDEYGHLSSWQSGRDCCQWSGITCNSQTGHVLKLYLNGTFDTPANLVGQISPSLLSLEYLEYLDLSTNFLEGPNKTVPQFLGSMKNLRHLDLSSIPFNGTVPPLFGNLTKLEYLDLSDTSFSGSLPPHLGNLSNLRHLDISMMENLHSTDVSWLPNLQFLEYIDMSNINLSTIVDFPLVANMIPTLKHIILSNCSLPSANQSIQHLNLTTLEELDLANNHFGHSVASCWFWNITSIKILSLQSTYLGGRIPDALGEMVSLRELGFLGNGNAATMTVDLKNLCELETLWLDGSLSSGNITEFLEKLPRCSDSKLSYLNLANNNMTGVLPNETEHLTGLVALQLLDISMNSLSGHLPLTFRAPNLKVLVLSSNYITGEVPESICESHNMRFLDLANNLFQGELPHCFYMKNMTFLLLNNNSFSGVFPSWIKGFSSMVFLNLSWNKFYGTIPRWIGDLASLRFLLLRHNMFSGDIPENITDLGALQYLDLAANNVSGVMPLSWSKLFQMTQKNNSVGPWDDYYILFFDLGRHYLSLVIKHNVLRYGPLGRVAMVGIDLSLNNLTGEIPDEITSLYRLINLNLSCNHLSGKIPESIGSMKSMESLDLSRNNLFGEIPSSLSDLTYLGTLDLSYNNLIGRIPSGRQLETLYSESQSIYAGNSGLCGPPLPRNCSASNSTESGSEMLSENDSGSLWFYFGFGSGFIVGLWVIFCALLFKKT